MKKRILAIWGYMLPTCPLMFLWHPTILANALTEPE